MILNRGNGVWRNLWFEAWIWICWYFAEWLHSNGCLQMDHLRNKLENCYYNATIIMIVYYYYYYYVYKISIYCNCLLCFMMFVNLFVQSLFKLYHWNNRSIDNVLSIDQRKILSDAFIMKLCFQWNYRHMDSLEEDK